MLREVLRTRYPDAFLDRDKVKRRLGDQVITLSVVRVYLDYPGTRSKYEGWFEFDATGQTLLEIFLPDSGEPSR